MLITPEILSAVNFARLSLTVSSTLVSKGSPVSRCGVKRARRGTMRNSCSLCVCLFVCFFFLTFPHSFLAIYLIILLLLFSVICVSCFNLHKVKLEENNALLKQKGSEDNNEQDDNPSRCIISVAKYQYQYVAINYVTIDEFQRK